MTACQEGDDRPSRLATGRGIPIAGSHRGLSGLLLLQHPDSRYGVLAGPLREASAPLCTFFCPSLRNLLDFTY